MLGFFGVSHVSEDREGELRGKGEKHKPGTWGRVDIQSFLFLFFSFLFLPILFNAYKENKIK